MRKSIGAKEWLYPEPVLIIGTFNEDGTADAMNAAWGGIADEKQIFICLSPEHKTVKNLLRTKAFTVSPAVASEVTACDYVGIVSGNDTADKINKTGWKVSKSEKVEAPIFDKLPFTIECNLISYDEAKSMCIGEIVDINCDESILTEEGKINLKNFAPVVYDPCNHEYLTFGEKAGKAFCDGKKIK